LISIEKGYPDLVVLQKNTNETFQLNGFQNSLVQDVQFIKVMGKLNLNKLLVISFILVLSEFSCDNCSQKNKLVD
jgi:hypothetical protein